MCIIPKEVCRQCSSNINVGQSVIVCEICNIIFHSKCLKTVEKIDENEVWACDSCQQKIVQRYNPFKNWVGPEPASDTINDIECGDDVMKISQILNNCISYTIKNS